MGLNVINRALQTKDDATIASGFDHATRTGDNTFSIFFKDGSKIDLTIPLPADGIDGEDGAPGADGTTYEPKVGSTITLPAGANATATATVSGTDVTFNFGIPQGIKGDKGDQGIQGFTGAQGEQGIQGQKGDRGEDGYPFLIYKQYDTIDEYTPDDFPEIGLMFMVMTADDDGYPIYRYTAEGELGYSLVTHMSDSTATQGAKGDKGDPGVTYTPIVGTVETLNAGSNATASVVIEGTTAKYNFGIPKGADSPVTSENKQITLDTLIGGTEEFPYHGDTQKMVSSDYAYKVFADILPKVDAKIQTMLNLAENINYFTVNTYAALMAYDIGTLDRGINLFLVKQDENYPREGAVDQYYSTIYIFNHINGGPTFDLVGKLNVSEKMIEENMSKAIVKALFNIDEETGQPTTPKYIPMTSASDFAQASDLGNYIPTSRESNFALKSELGTQATFSLSGTTLNITTL